MSSQGPVPIQKFMMTTKSNPRSIGGLRRIISGAQTGVDRGAIDSVIERGKVDGVYRGSYYSWGGCVPRGRLAEDGEIPGFYFNPGFFGCGLVEHSESRDYKSRTVQNCKDSDATLILRFQGGGRILSPGTKLTLKVLREMGKPYRILDPSNASHIMKAVRWICETVEESSGRYIQVLNVAGPRESKQPGIYGHSLLFMSQIQSYVFSCQRLGMRL